MTATTAAPRLSLLGSAAALALAWAAPAAAQDAGQDAGQGAGQDAAPAAPGDAAAQDFCGGAAANGQWIGGDEAASDVSAAASHLEQMALVLMGNEYVALFSLSQPATVRLEAQGRGAGDPVVDLLDEAGAVVASDDDSGGNAASRIETALEPGRYCLSMRSFDGSPMTGFVRVGRQEHEALTVGLDATAPMDPAAPPTDPAADPYAAPYAAACDPASTSTALGPVDAQLYAGGAAITASVNESPTIGFTLGQPAAVTITAENPDADPVITLYDEFGTYLAENDDYDGLNSRIDMTYPLQPGSYCITLDALSDPSLPITVSVSGYDPAAAQLGMYNRAEAAPPLDGSHPVTQLGPLGSRLRQDVTSTDTATWFAFEVPEAGLVVVEAITNGLGDPMLVMFDDFGREVAYNDDYGNGYDASLSARVQPGTYLVAVRENSEGAQALTRMLFERFVPAQ